MHVNEDNDDACNKGYEIDINIKYINNYIKENVWIVPLLYLIGNLCLLIRNKKYNLPFYSFSITQLSALFTYSVVFYIMFNIMKGIIKTTIDTIKDSKYDKKGKCIFCFLYITVAAMLSVLYTIAINCLILDVTKSIGVIIASLLIIIHSTRLNKKKNIFELFVICMSSLVIIEIPISLGGLKGLPVYFHVDETNQIEEYMYYGTNEGLYQFVDNGNVLLIPIDDGYITYNNNSKR